MKRSMVFAALVLACACQKSDDGKIPPVTLDRIPGHDSIAQDTGHKESPRLLPAEVYMRSYLMLFGGANALSAQRDLAQNGLFDSWGAYLSALGLPNYALDLPRKEETNALMMATFERLGIALCNRAIEKDLQGMVSIDKRIVYRFDLKDDPKDGRISEATFLKRFAPMHRRFLGYPLSLAKPDRGPRFYKLYLDTVAAHDPRNLRLRAEEAGWSAICQGLVRHPEFHLY